MTTQSCPPGTVLANRYQILRPLGRGGMGTLYLARDTRFGRRYVALKENGDRSPAAQAQFRLEAEVLATLHHPYLPAVTDHFITADGRQFLVMDYVEGENLEERVTREGSVPEALVLAWADQILDALAYLHTQSPPIIHRDVKPQNVIVRSDGRAVLVDFGITKHLVAGQPTATVARAGSPGYAPIEQYAGGTDQRSDLYSLGATLYLALTGYVPPEAPLLAAGQTLPHPRQLNLAISTRTETTILRAMQTDAGRRFQSAEEMRAALQGGRSPGQESITQVTRRKKTILLVGAVLVAAALCALAALGWATYGPDRSTPTPTSAPTATVEIVPTATTTPVTVPTTVQPTDTVSPGPPTSTPATTLMPMDTPRTLAPTPEPTPTPTLIPASTQPPQPGPPPTTEPPTTQPPTIEPPTTEPPTTQPPTIEPPTTQPPTTEPPTTEPPTTQPPTPEG